jgi:adenine-specific DNA-methyltransferase
VIGVPDHAIGAVWWSVTHGILLRVSAQPQALDRAEQVQLALGQEDPAYVAGEEPLALGQEDPAYLTQQLVTYIGNKRALLGAIRSAVEDVIRRTGRDKLRILDAFSGSGVVSRMLRAYASELIVNDFEDYARAISECYMANRSAAPMETVRERVVALNAAVDAGEAPHGFIRRLYAPADTGNIRPEDRVFYTPENGYRLDAYRQSLDGEDPMVRKLLMGPLLSAASIHANTAGVFKGFYKDRTTGLGKLGGTGSDALERITRTITLCPPVLSAFECDTLVLQQDANTVARTVGDLDLVYFDPPYNQHPYGSNYFMLNLIVNYDEPSEISRVSGIPADWQRSDYNVKSKSLTRVTELVEDVDARFVILSFNDEGFVSPSEMRDVLGRLGRVTEQRQPHATFRGCRNLRDRSFQVTEHVYLIEKK